jgi:hypothetical protein
MRIELVLYRLRLTKIMLLLAGMTTACGATPARIENADAALAASANTTGKTVTRPNQSFRNLDEYLAYLEKTQGPVDGPWYREIRPGVYELQTGNLRVLGADGEQKRIFTREELEKQFGFAK